MKKIVLFALLYFSALAVQAQHSYVPMAEPGKFWYKIKQYAANPNIEQVNILFTYGDTTIGNYHYTKLYEFTNQDIYALSDTNDIDGMPPLSLLRDDTLNRKVYQLPVDTTVDFGTDEEHLLLDFNLEVGDFVDSLMIARTSQWLDGGSAATLFNHEYGRILYKDSTVFNGTARISYGFIATLPSLPDANYPVFIKEGIGPLSTRNIFYKETFTSFDNPCEGSFLDCFPLVMSAQDLRPEQITLSPNPTTDIVYIELELPITTAYLMDAQGRGGAVRVENNQVRLGGLPAGVYVLHLMDGDGKRYVGRVVVGE